MSEHSPIEPLAFLRGDQYIFELIMSRDWNDTELGHPAQWPLRLKYAVSAQLVNPCPSFVVWGKSRTLIYNAAFAALFPETSLPPDQHGLGELAFGSHWYRVSQAVEDAFLNKGAVIKGVRIGSQGRLGQRYVDISVGSLIELDGEIFGAWGICQEKTFEMVAGDMLRSSKQYLRSLIGNAPMGICVIASEPLHIAEVNDEFLRLMGHSAFAPQVLGAVQSLLGDLNAYVNDGSPKYLKEAAQELLVDGNKRIGYIDVMVSPFPNNNGQTSGMTVMAIDVTDRVEAHQELFQVNEELAAANEELASSNEELQTINEDLDLSQRNLKHSLEQLGQREQQIRQMVASAPFPIALYLGREMRIVEANQALIKVWGKGDDVVGKTYHEVLPELENQSVYEQLEAVYDTGIPFHARNQRIDLVVSGRLQTFYFNYSFTPLFDISGKVFGVMNTAADVTDLVVAMKGLQQGEENFRNIILQAPVAMCLLDGPEHRITIANAAMLDIWGREWDEVMEKPVFEALTDARAQGLEEAMSGVYHSGEPFYAAEQAISLIRRGKPEIVYQNFVYQPYRDAKGKVSGILAISVNVTEMVLSRKKVEQAYSRLNLVVEAAELGMFDMDLKTGKLDWDERCKKFFGIDPQQQTVDYERDFVSALHAEDVTSTLAAVERAMDPSGDGSFIQEYRVKQQHEQERWIRAAGRVYFDEQHTPERFAGVVSDISKSKIDELQARESVERKSHLAAIVDSSDDVIISKDLNGKITSWNPSAERMFGYSTSEALGQHVSLLIPNDRNDEEDMIISRVRRGEKVDRFDTERRARDGSIKQLSITVSPIFNADGEVIGASKIARDISQQLAAKKATARYTERIEAINLVINAISTEIDSNHILQRVTQLIMHLVGAEIGFFVVVENEDGLLGDYIAPVTAIPVKELGKTAQTLNGLVSNNPDDRVQVLADLREHQIMYHLGQKTALLASLIAVRVVSSQEKLIGNLYFGHHVAGYFNNDHQELLQAIASHLSIAIDKASLYDKVMELNRKKDEFISLASHELKTPLTGINGYVQILKKMVKDELPGRYLTKTMQQINKLTSLVNDLLDVSKIEAGKLRFEFVRMELSVLVKSTIEMLGEIHEGYSINFVNLSDECWVEADNQRMEQVLTNLLSNAIKYSPGATLIEVSLAKKDNMAIIGVRDYGIGIPEDKMSQLFSRFYRVDENTPNISGLGIGLYLSREIVARHKGEIWLESEIGKGSIFWFSLPLAN